MEATVRVLYRYDDGLWWAESPDVDGFVASGESLAEVRKLVTEGLPFYLDHDSLEIEEAQSGGRAVSTASIIASPWAAIDRASGSTSHGEASARDTVTVRGRSGLALA